MACFPLYLSAHTHTGYATDAVSTDPTGVLEINVGSLIDNELHYRDLDIRLLKEGRELSVRSRKHLLGDELCLGPGLLSAVRKGKTGAETYLSLGVDRGNSNKAAWCARLSRAATLLSDFNASLVPMTPQECLDGTRRLSEVLSAEAKMIDSLAKDEDNRAAKACEAIGGAQAFRFDFGVPPKEVYFQFTKTGSRWVPSARH
jgi:hypothetical protein